MNFKNLLKLFLGCIWFMPFHSLSAYQLPNVSAIEWTKAQQQKLTEMNNSIISEDVTHFLTNNRLTELNGIPFLKKNRLLIFMSFSMPIQSIKQWLNQASQVNGTLIIRGLVNHSFKQTISKVKELLDGRVGSLQIDPGLFKQYSIQKVPAMVLEADSDVDVVYGDVPLVDALGRVVKESSHQDFAQNLLSILEKNNQQSKVILN